MNRCLYKIIFEMVRNREAIDFEGEGGGDRTKEGRGRVGEK